MHRNSFRRVAEPTEIWDARTMCGTRQGNGDDTSSKRVMTVAKSPLHFDGLAKDACFVWKAQLGSTGPCKSLYMRLTYEAAQAQLGGNLARLKTQQRRSLLFLSLIASKEPVTIAVRCGNLQPCERSHLLTAIADLKVNYISMTSLIKRIRLMNSLFLLADKHCILYSSK